MRVVIQEIRMIFLDFKMNFFTKRVFVLLVLYYVLSHIFLMPLRDLSESMEYPVAPWTPVFLLSDMYFLLIFICGCIYYFSNTPFFTYEQIYRILRLGKVRWGIHKLAGILLGAVCLVASVWLVTECILLSCTEWDMGWGKLLYTLSLTDLADGIDFFVSYDVIKTYLPVQALGRCFGIGVLVIALLGNSMFAASLYFSRTAALAAASAEVATVIMYENMYRFPQMIYVSPVSWMRMDKMLSLYQNAMPALSVQEMAVVLVSANLVCAALILYKVRYIDFSNTVKRM